MVTICLDDNKPRELVYDWKALAQLKTDLGDDWHTTAYKAAQSLDPEVLADVLLVGLSKYPEVTKENFMSSTLPLLSASQSLTSALDIAFHGKSYAEEAQPENKPRPVKLFFYRLFGWVN